MERYWISGVELGMLLAFIEGEQDRKAKELIEEIIDKQYLGTKEDFDKIVKKVKK
jgi:hypothetical protein